MRASEAEKMFMEAFTATKKAAEYVPTGIQDVVIKEFGSGDWDVVTDEKPNKVGKTCTGAAIARAIIWPEYADKYFPDKLYQDWKYPKVMCILASNENLQEGKPIRQEIKQWWPAGRYTEHKSGAAYVKRYETDTGWVIHCMSFQQEPEQFEGPLYGFIWIDEVPKPWQIVAMTSRLGDGGVILNTMTPLAAAAATKVYDDLADQGLKVLNLTADVYDDDSEKGPYNRLKTRRGRRTHEQIDKWVAGIAPSYRAARVHGQRTGGGGLLHPGFNNDAHVIRIHDFSEYAAANHYMVIDPVGGSYYPFVQWWMVTRDNRAICYNEWPDKNELGDMFYDQARKTMRCPHSLETISDIMLVKDFTQFGYAIRQRVVDPLFARGSKDPYHKRSTGVIDEFMQASMNKIILTMAPVERISVQTENINNLMEYNRLAPVSSMNRPRVQWASHCLNSIRSAQRVQYKEESEEVNEEYKDPDDCTRYFLAAIGGDPIWKDFTEKPKQKYYSAPPEQNLGTSAIAIG